MDVLITGAHAPEPFAAVAVVEAIGALLGAEATRPGGDPPSSRNMSRSQKSISSRLSREKCHRPTPPLIGPRHRRSWRSIQRTNRLVTGGGLVR